MKFAVTFFVCTLLMFLLIGWITSWDSFDQKVVRSIAAFCCLWGTFTTAVIAERRGWKWLS